MLVSKSLKNQRIHMKTKAKLSSLFLSLIIGNYLFATNYYVKNGGDDLGVGTTPGTAWETLSKVYNETYLPGDSILFERGGVWREQELQISSSGTLSEYIVYGAYGQGEKPRILGSRQLVTWENYSGDVWRAACDFNPFPASYDIAELFIETLTDEVIWTSNVGSVGNVNDEYEWTWDNDWIYLYTTVNPNTGYNAIEAPNTLNMVHLNDHEYIQIENIEIAYSRRTGIYDSYGSDDISGLRIYNNHIHHIHVLDGPVGYGINSKHSDLHIANNDIHDCGRRNISLVVYETDPAMHIQNILIENNYLHNGWHTTGVDLNTTGDHHIENVTIRNNYFHDPAGPDLEQNPDWGSNMIFLANQGGDEALVEKVYIYNNIFNTVRGNGVLIEGVSNVSIHHNTFYAFDPTRDSYTAFISSGGDTIDIKNNIFYNNGVSAFNTNLYSVDFTDASSFLTSECDYNLYYNVEASSRFFMLQARGQGGFSGNYYYYTTSEWNDYKTDLGRDLNSPTPANPLFVNAPDDLALQEGTPAFENGTSLAYSTDYFGNPRSLLSPTIGAIEFANPDSTLAFIEQWTFDEQFSAAVIDTTAKTVAIAVVNGTDLSSLVPTILVNIGASINPTSGVANDFSSPAAYTITAPNGVSQNIYTVTVSEAPNQAPEISNVEISGNPYIDSTISVVYNYYDLEGDLEGQTEFDWYSGGVSSGVTSKDYIIQSSDSAKSIYCIVTPVALTGELNGVAVNSDTTEAVTPFSVKILSADLGEFDNSTIIVDFDSALQSSFIPEINDFSVTENGNAYGIHAVGIVDGNLHLAMDSIAHYGNSYLVSYSSGSTMMQCASGIEVLSWSDTIVNNKLGSTIFENLVLYSEELDNTSGWGDAGQETRITANQHNDLDGNLTLELLQHGENSNNMILINQSGISGNITGNTSYTLEFDVYSDDPSTGDNGWRVHIYENSGANELYYLYGDSVISGELTRISYTFTTQAGTNQLAIRPVDRWSPNWEGYWGRVHLYRGNPGDRLYIKTLGSQIVDSIASGNSAEPSTADNIINFSIPEEEEGSIVNSSNHTISILVLCGTSLGTFTPEIGISSAASISPENGTAQDFTSPVEYTVTAEDGVTQQVWIATAIVNTIVETSENLTICSGEDYTYPDGTTQTTILTDTTQTSSLVAVLTGCDSIVTTNITVDQTCGILEDLVLVDTTTSPGAANCFNALNNITIAGDGSTVSFESGSTVNVIAGESIRFLPGFHAKSGSSVIAEITTTDIFCDDLPQAIVATEPIAEKSFDIENQSENIKLEIEGASLKVFPNPNNGYFKVQLKNMELPAMIMIFNASGAMVYESEVYNADTKISLKTSRKGIYFVRTTNGVVYFKQKIIVE